MFFQGQFSDFLPDACKSRREHNIITNFNFIVILLWTQTTRRKQKTHVKGDSEQSVAKRKAKKLRMWRLAALVFEWGRIRKRCGPVDQPKKSL